MSDEIYTYNANGNRTIGGYTTGANNQLLSDGTYNYQYDDEGSRTRREHISSGEFEICTWDHHNRLSSVYEDNKLTSQVAPFGLKRAEDKTCPASAIPQRGDRAIAHHRPTRGGNVQERADRRLNSQWFGSGARLKAKAWDLALAMAT